MDISFKAVMLAFEYAEQQKVNEVIELLIPELDIDIPNKVDLINSIFNSLQKAVKSDGKRTIDFKIDYRLIWDSFKSARQMDLNKDKINWWEFNSMLEGIFLEGNASICKVVGFRTEKLPKADKYNKDYINFVKQMKLKYRLKNENKEGLSILYNYLNEKVGEKDGS